MVVGLDLDGTLIDAERRQAGLALHLLEATGRRPVDPVAFWSLKREGHTTAGALEALGVPADDAGDIARRWRDQIEDPAWLLLDAVLPGVDTALAELRATARSVFVLTARRDAAAVTAQIDRLGLGFGPAEIDVVPPARAAAEKAAALERRKADALIGDTEVDAQAAAAAGVRFVGVTSGQRSGAALRRSGVTDVCDGLAAALAGLRG